MPKGAPRCIFQVGYHQGCIVPCAKCTIIITAGLDLTNGGLIRRYITTCRKKHWDMDCDGPVQIRALPELPPRRGKGKRKNKRTMPRPQPQPKTKPKPVGSIWPEPGASGVNHGQSDDADIDFDDDDQNDIPEYDDSSQNVRNRSTGSRISPPLDSSQLGAEELQKRRQSRESEKQNPRRVLVTF